MHDAIETDKLPVTLVLITPDLTDEELKTVDKDRGYGLEHALWANDPLNRRKISTKNPVQTNLLGPDGSVSHFQASAQALKGLNGTLRYPIDGLTDLKSKELWWSVERGYPGAINNLKAVAAKKSPTQADAVRILGAVTSATSKRQDELVAAPASFAAYVALETFLINSQGLDAKLALARLKELKAAREVKDELMARDIYQQCQQLLASPKGSSQKAGNENMATLAKKFPDTVYGQRAASVK